MQTQSSWLPVPSTAIAAPSIAPPAPNPNTEIVLSINYDGTEPWSGNAADEDGQGGHKPGDDSGPNNLVVRTFDMVQYRIDWNVNEQDATNVVIKAVLPADMDLEWVIDPSLPLPPGCIDSGVTPLSSISPDGKTLLCNLGDQPEGTSGTIFPIMQVNQQLDNDDFTINSTIETDQSSPVTSNDVTVTISAAPTWDWKKDIKADVYRDVMYNGVAGQVTVWPIYLVPGSDDGRGVEQLNDTPPIQFFDHLYYWSTNMPGLQNATLITAADIANMTNYDGRICGGYTGSGGFPYGVSGLGDATNTTVGAQVGTESIVCTLDSAATTAASYPVVQIDISGHNTQSAPPNVANGKVNKNNIVIAAQIAFFIPDGDLFPTSSGLGYLHNAISKDTTPIAAPTAEDSLSTVSTSSSIQAAGTSVVVDETTTADNLALAELSASLPTLPERSFKHWVEFNPGLLQLREVTDSVTGLPMIGFDHRKAEIGGLGRHGLGPKDGGSSSYDFGGEVARGQDFTVSYNLSTKHDTLDGVDFASAHREAVHGCLYIDNTYVDVTELPGAIDVIQVGTDNYNATATGGYTLSPSHPQAHVSYGDAQWNRIRYADLVRMNPAFQPNYALEFATAATSVGTSYDRHDVTCRDADAAGGWIDANDPNFDGIFNKSADGRYQNIELVRLRTLEEVPWTMPFPIEEPALRNDSGASFEIHLNLRVKTTIADPIDGTHKIYTHGSRASGDWDGVANPPTPLCGNIYFDTFAPTQTNDNPPNGFCNLATEPVEAGGSDSLEIISTKGIPYGGHRDTVTVISSVPYIEKQNLAGLADLVDNGDLVTFRIDVGITGADIATDAVENVVMRDTLPAEFEFVEFVGSQSTQFELETTATPGAAIATPICAYTLATKEIACDFGDQAGGWRDAITVTVRTVDAEADQVIENMAEIESDNRDTKSSVAYAYMIPARHELEIRKEVLDLDGDCSRDPGVSAHVAGDCSMIRLDSPMTFTLHYTNSGNVTLKDIQLIDVLPFVGDTTEPQASFLGDNGTPNAGANTVGDGRTPASAFSGTVQLLSVTDSNSFAIKHTTEGASTVNRDPASNTNAWSAGTASAATAIRVDMPTLAPGQAGTVVMVLGTSGNATDDIYTNNFGVRATGASGEIRVPNRSNDVSVMPLEMTLGSTVWLDSDNNGFQDAGEAGIGGLSVELYKPGPDGAIGGGDDVLVGITTTNTAGDYFFGELDPGDYYVAIPNAPTAAPLSSTPTNTNDDNVDGDDNGDQPGGTGTATYSPIVTLDPQTEPTAATSETEQGNSQDDQDDANGDMTIDFGFFNYVSIGSTVFYDNDDSGTQDGGDNGIPGIVVELRDITGTVLLTDTTDANGDYFFGDLMPGDYQVAIPTPPSDAPNSSSPTDMADNQEDSDDNGDQPGGAGTPAISPVITLSADGEPDDEAGQGSGQDDADDDNGDMTIDFGFVPSVSVGSTLFYDNDDNGTQDSSETGIPGIVVELQNITGTVLLTDTTDSNGDYFFGDLLPGQYQVVIPTPPAQAPTSSTATNTADDNTDRDDNGDQPGGLGTVVSSPVITLTVGGEPTDEPGQGGTQDTATDPDADANGDMSVDFGFVPAYSIGSTLFYDDNDNGQQGTGENGIPGIVVQLRDITGTVLLTDTTDENGDYFFGDLAAGDYQVVVPTPPADAPMSSTPTNTADDNTDGDDNGSQTTIGGPTTSPTITLSLGDEPVGETKQGGTQDDLVDSNGDMTVDFGFVKPLSLGSTLFYDHNDDGLQGAGDAGIPGITVELHDSSGTLLATTTTDSNGDYLFEKLPPGGYQVVVPTPPSDAPTSSSPTNTADDNTDGDDNGSQTTSGASTTSPIITLTPDGEPTGEAKQGGTQDAADDNNGDMTVDFGFVPPVSLGSTLFYDNDNNGIHDTGEAGIAGIVVELYNGTGTQLIATTTTDSNGDYLFGGLPRGDYLVMIPTPPSDAPISSTPTNGADDNTDGDDNGEQPTGAGGLVLSPVITLTPDGEPVGETEQGGIQDAADDNNGDMTVDFGFVPPLSLGSTLFYDNDNSGTQDAGEAGIAGIVVELYDDLSVQLIMTTTTDSNGDYLFDELLPGGYIVAVPTPPSDAPTSSTPTNVNDDNVDGDDNGEQLNGAGTPVLSPVITLANNSEPTGETEQGGTQDAVDDDNGDMTVDFGFAPYVSLGSTVFHDANNDGLQGANDAGIPGVTVELHDAAGTLVETTTTDSNGDYLFDELLAGDYQVVIPTPPSIAPISSTPTDGADNQEDGDDNGDQPGGSGTATTSPMITLVADGEPTGEPEQGGTQDSADDDNGDMTVDFGFFAPVRVGDVVWVDNDDDGEQDSGEPGVPGVTVKVYNGDGTEATDTAGNPVPAEVTDSTGHYLFDDLPPGDYYVEFDLDTLPGPAWSVAKHDEAGVSDALDSDGDPTTGESGTTQFLNSGEEDLTLDMGIVAPVTVGDRVWYDDDRDGLQTPGEAGVKDVLAVLYDTATGQPVTDQFGVPLIDVTDANGNYLFENLPPNDYYVQFQLNTLPPGYVVTTQDATSDQQPATSDHLDSDVDPSLGRTAPTGFLPPNTEDLTLDMGIYQPDGVRVGDRVWLDSDKDGIQDPAEVGVPGVTVTLVDGAGNAVTEDRDGNPIMPQVTTPGTVGGQGGNYIFENLPDGDYAVVFDLSTLPPGYVVTTQDATSNQQPTTSDQLDSDGDPTTGMTAWTDLLTQGEEDLTLDLGIYPSGDVRVGDYVWYDNDGDGVQDGDEAGVEDVTVHLFNADGTPATGPNGNPVPSTTTDANGEYIFEGLPAGDYYVQFDLGTLPDGYQPTTQDATSNQQPATSDQSDSDADPTTGETAPTGPLANGEEDLTLDMGIVAPVRVGDVVWYDNDRDGLQDAPADEPGVADVTVELFNADGTSVTDMAGNPVGPAVTDADGEYLFENLPPGDYYVQFDLGTLPDSYVPTSPNEGGNDGADSDASLSTGETATTGFLPAGTEDLTLDMGIVQRTSVRVGDRVWYDDNMNGIQDPGETGVEDVTVELFNGDGTPVTDVHGNPVGPTATDSAGNYLFDDLPEGDYYVQFDLGTLPDDSIITLQDATNDQQPATSDQLDSDVDPATGQTATTDDLLAGDEDLTLDMGIYRPASLGDTVWYDVDQDGIQDADELGVKDVVVKLFNADGSPATDMNGNVMNTTTDGSGQYLFDDLLPGDYYVEFQTSSLPVGYQLTVQDAPSNQSPTTNDQVDSDADPVTGQTAVTTLVSGEHDPTWDAGIYQDLPDDIALPGAVRVGDRVWYDDNINGIQDPGEAGVEDVTVNLFNVDGTPVLDMNNNLVGPTKTDMQGNYIFDNLPEGDYYVQFDLGTLPEDSIVTLQDATNDQQPATSDQSDSDADPETGETAPTGHLSADEEDLTLDMGIYRPASLGDRVWYDLDKDGIQDSGEPGIEDVVVELFNADGTPATDIEGNPMSTTTDEDGHYMFDDLLPGDYYVEFTAPAGYEPSPQDATNSQSPATSDQSDSDADPTTGQTVVTTLTSGENDPTWDAGFYQEDVPDSIPTPESGTVRVGDRVWYDYDDDGIQDDPADEPGVEGVTVILLNADGTPATDLAGDPIAPLVTDSNGEYLFDDLPPGDYRVMFDLDTLPENHVVARQDATDDQQPATSDQSDSDADPTTGQTGDTGPLSPGEEDLTLDMGIVPVGEVMVGDTVWYDEDGDGTQDDPADEPGVEGVVATLYNADGTPVVDLDGKPVKSQTTDSNGKYLFDNLPAGDYYVQFDPATLPDGYEPTEANATDGESPADSDQTDSDVIADLATGSLQTANTGFLPSGSVDPTLDMGIVREEPVRVGDRVWYDEDSDGIQDDVADEPGVAGVEVKIFNADGAPVTDMDGNGVGPTITNGDGEYLFENLPAGDYYVQFILETLPENYVVTEANATNNQSPATSDQSDSDANTSTGKTDTTGFIPGGEEDLTLDMGIVQLVPDVRVGDFVWLDQDRNGLQDDGEPGVPGVTVALYDSLSGDLLAETVTDSDGNYLFDDLHPGDYFVEFDLGTLPANHAVTKPNATNDQSPTTSDQLDSDVDPEEGRSDITGILFNGEEDLSLDMGIYQVDSVTVGDRVWYDLDGDGLQDDDEPGVENVTATLYDATTREPVPGVPSQQTTAGQDGGNYLFEDLPAGDYYVVFDLETIPDGYGVTTQNATNDQSPTTSDQIDSDAHPAAGRTDETGPLSGNDEDLTLDMGIVKLPGVTVGDYVWFDDNGDGVQDPTEDGVPGVTVYVYDALTGEAVTDEAGDPLTQVTDAAGEYLFTDLAPGQYQVRFDLDTLPDDYVVSPAGTEASDTADSDADPTTGETAPTAVLTNGDVDRTLDMGIYKPVVVGDRVWFDDGNGQQDEGEAGVPDVTVTLYDTASDAVVTTTTTDSDGNYLFDNLPPGDYYVSFNSLPEGYQVTAPNMGADDSDSDVSDDLQTAPTGFLESGDADLTLDMGIVQPVEVGNYVWYDNDMDGIQDADESGVEGVAVTLHDVTGELVATTTTDSDGAYLFSDLPPGDYYVIFDLDSTPDGYVATQANVTNDQSPGTSDQLDSDANPGSGQTASTGFLPSGSVDDTLDLGIHIPTEDLVRVGGQVWEDHDANSALDPDERLLPGIVVQLYSQGDPNTPIAEMETDEDGNYLFENLSPGDYFTTLLAASLPEGALPPSYYSAGTLDNLRSNAGTLEPGDEALELDMALRFPGSLSGLVWLDEDGNGVRVSDESKIDGTTVLLYDATGEVVGEMETDATGSYHFDDLLPGDYRVEFVTSEVYGISPKLQGDDSTMDSDADPTTRQTGATFVGSGEHVPDIDMGLYEGASVTSALWFDTDGNGIQDEGEAGMPNVTVFLFNSANQVVGETVTDDEGRYSFGGLLADEYYAAFKQPSDMLPNAGLIREGDDLVRGPSITVDAGGNISAEDIGFTQPAAIGNYVWLDTNKDGVADKNEIGVASIAVRLLDAEGNVVDSTKTDSDGRFEFSVMPGDYQLEFDAMEGMDFTVQNQGDDSLDSDVDPETGRTVLISVAPNTSDFSHYAGLIVSPTAIQLMSLTAVESTSGVAVEWSTGTELSTFGYEVYRSRDGKFENAVALTDALILARGNDEVYTFTDGTARAGQVYSYWLVEVQNDQQTYHYGPTRVMVEGIQTTAQHRMIFLPLIQK